MLNSLKAISIDDVEWELICEPEHVPVEGNCMASGDDAFDRKCERRILRQLANGNEWAWCCVRLVGRFKGLCCWEALGCCSYRSEKEFRKDPYFADMQSEVLRQLQEEASNIAEFFVE